MCVALEHAHAPTGFVVARSLLSEGVRPVSEIAGSLSLPRGSVHRVVNEIKQKTAFDPTKILDWMLDAKRKPTWTTVLYYAPNPSIWQQAFPQESGLSGEHAAEVIDQLDLVSDKCIFYVPPGSLYQTIHAAEKIKAKVAPASKANLAIRPYDPWLRVTSDGFVERGQRFYDYITSKNIYLRRWRPQHDLLSA